MDMGYVSASGTLLYLTDGVESKKFKGWTFEVEKDLNCSSLTDDMEDLVIIHLF